MTGQTTVRAVIRGRVQGVGYRAWTRDRALALGLSGTVRNRPDGSVEAVLSGARAAVERMVAALREGPPGARVTDVVTDAAAEPVPGAPASGFAILRG